MNVTKCRRPCTLASRICSAQQLEPKFRERAISQLLRNPTSLFRLCIFRNQQPDKPDIRFKPLKRERSAPAGRRLATQKEINHPGHCRRARQEAPIGR
jgi:hypothetical protein